MRVRTVKTFRDKNTKELHKAGSFFVTTEQRAEEINSARLGPFVEIVEEATKPKKKEEVTQKEE